MKSIVPFPVSVLEAFIVCYKLYLSIHSGNISYLKLKIKADKARNIYRVLYKDNYYVP